MDINAQIKVLEALLKHADNRECSDCHSKTPRWAAITFGAFVCLRCSGQHRQLQVHISKIKSVNLDKWAPDMVEMYKHVNNAIINSYWEARLPRGFQKPGQNAPSSEVESFIRDKYVNKKWIDTGMDADPANLYWHDRKKFDKFIKRATSGEEADSDDEKKKKKEKKHKKKSKKHAASSESEEVEVPKPVMMSSVATTATKMVAKAPPVAFVGDLINMESLPASVPSGSAVSVAFDGFQDFQDADPMKSTDDFSDFQQASHV
jgi:stromal membrane-associated protein